MVGAGRWALAAERWAPGAAGRISPPPLTPAASGPGSRLVGRLGSGAGERRRCRRARVLERSSARPGVARTAAGFEPSWPSGARGRASNPASRATPRHQPAARSSRRTVRWGTARRSPRSSSGTTGPWCRCRSGRCTISAPAAAAAPPAAPPGCCYCEAPRGGSAALPCPFWPAPQAGVSSPRPAAPQLGPGRVSAGKPHCSRSGRLAIPPETCAPLRAPRRRRCRARFRPGRSSSLLPQFR